MKAVTSQPPEPAPGAGAAVASAESSRTGEARVRTDRWARYGMDRGVLPSRATLIAVGAAGVVALGQLAEDLADSPGLQMLPPTVVIPRWTVIVVTVYMLLIARALDVTVRRFLPSLRPVVRIDDRAFEAYAQRMRNPGMSVQAALLAASAVLVAMLFIVIGQDLPLRDPVSDLPRYLPGDGLSATVVLAGYAVLGWALLWVFVATVRLARTLGDLSREPLIVDVFNTSNLLPFGQIALVVASAPAGVIVILLLGFGQPGSWYGWAILLLATVASLLALLLPLHGTHQQMAQAKQAVAADLDRRISHVYEELTDTALGTARMTKLNEATNTLVPLRKTVAEMTTWPFRSTVAFGRAVLVASAPLVYAALSEVIRVFWIAPMGR